MAACDNKCYNKVVLLNTAGLSDIAITILLDVERLSEERIVKYLTFEELLGVVCSNGIDCPHVSLRPEGKSIICT